MDKTFQKHDHPWPGNTELKHPPPWQFLSTICFSLWREKFPGDGPIKFQTLGISLATSPGVTSNGNANSCKGWGQREWGDGWKRGGWGIEWMCPRPRETPRHVFRSPLFWPLGWHEKGYAVDLTAKTRTPCGYSGLPSPPSLPRSHTRFKI